ncbi:MAG: alpha-hydroxy-acid oxidizing protein [Clostridiales bacterium]|nr:alpha-hydroxy-acid oxidizing protein [Clostridiales bacterium]
MAELPGDSIRIAREYMDSLCVESRLLGAQKPDARLKLLGHEFDTPIMTGALSHIDLVGMAEGARLAGAAVSVGMGDNTALRDVLDTGAKVIKIIKPYADRNEIYERLSFAKANGAIGVGMDIEHALRPDSPEDDVVLGQRMRLPSLEELKEFIRFAGLPFFIKGALSVSDALSCAELGCAGVILSHHNGIMRCAVPPVRLLPDIRKAVGDSLLLIADGGIESGYDAFKALALGADAVCVGRALMGPLKERGAEGVRETIMTMTAQLEIMLYRTGSKDIRHIDPSVIWDRNR